MKPPRPPPRHPHPSIGLTASCKPEIQRCGIGFYSDRSRTSDHALPPRALPPDRLQQGRSCRAGRMPRIRLLPLSIGSRSVPRCCALFQTSRHRRRGLVSRHRTAGSSDDCRPRMSDGARCRHSIQNRAWMNIRAPGIGMNDVHKRAAEEQGAHGASRTRVVPAPPILAPGRTVLPGNFEVRVPDRHGSPPTTARS